MKNLNIGTNLDFGKNMKIGKKLAIGFGVATAIMIILTAIGLFNMKRMDSKFSQVIDLNASRIEKANTAIHSIDQIFYAMAVIPDDAG